MEVLSFSAEVKRCKKLNIKNVWDVLKRDRLVSLVYLSLATGESTDDLLFIFDEWEARGRVQTIEERSGCTGECSRCPSNFLCSSNTGKIYRLV